MYQNDNFEEFLNNNVLDLSKLESNRQNYPEETIMEDSDNGFLASKSYIDIHLDRSHYMHSVSADTCLQYCFNNNILLHANKLTNDDMRSASGTCQYNCLNKIKLSYKMFKTAVKDHPREQRIKKDMNDTDDMVNKFRQQVKAKNQQIINYQI